MILNKKISAPITIFVILMCAILAGGIVWDYKNINISGISDWIVESPNNDNLPDSSPGPSNGDSSSDHEVVISVDKDKYERNEKVNISLKNNLEQSVWYQTGCQWRTFWYIQKLEKEEWKNWPIGTPHLEQGEKACALVQCEWTPPTELKSGSQKNDQWDLSLDFCEFKPSMTVPEPTPKKITPGVYRIVFPYRLKGEVSSPVPPAEKVYSDRFNIVK